MVFSPYQVKQQGVGYYARPNTSTAPPLPPFSTHRMLQGCATRSPRVMWRCSGRVVYRWRVRWRAWSNWTRAWARRWQASPRISVLLGDERLIALSTGNRGCVVMVIENMFELRSVAATVLSRAWMSAWFFLILIVALWSTNSGFVYVTIDCSTICRYQSSYAWCICLFSGYMDIWIRDRTGHPDIQSFRGTRWAFIVAGQIWVNISGACYRGCGLLRAVVAFERTQSAVGSCWAITKLTSEIVDVVLWKFCFAKEVFGSYF